MSKDEELKMTRTSVTKLLSEKKKLCKSNFELRHQLTIVKKQLLNLQNSFVVQKSKYTTKIRSVKKELKKQKLLLNKFMIDDDDFIVDPETGILDLTQPKTPQKPKRKQPVSSVSCKKKLKM